MTQFLNSLDTHKNIQLYPIEKGSKLVAKILTKFRKVPEVKASDFYRTFRYGWKWLWSLDFTGSKKLRISSQTNSHQPPYLPELRAIRLQRFSDFFDFHCELISTHPPTALARSVPKIFSIKIKLKFTPIGRWYSLRTFIVRRCGWILLKWRKSENFFVDDVAQNLDTADQNSVNVKRRFGELIKQ